MATLRMRLSTPLQPTREPQQHPTSAPVTAVPCTTSRRSTVAKPGVPQQPYTGPAFAPDGAEPSCSKSAPTDSVSSDDSQFTVDTNEKMPSASMHPPSA